MAANFKTFVRAAILPTSTSSYIVSSALPQGPVQELEHPHRVHKTTNRSIENRFYRLGNNFGWKHRAVATGHAKIPLSLDSASGNVNTNDLSLVLQIWKVHVMRKNELIGVGVVPLREIIAELSDLSSRSYRSSLSGVLPGGLAGIALDKFIALTSTQNPSHSLGMIHLLLRVPQAIPNEYWFAQRNQALNMNLPLVESTALEPAKTGGLASQVNQPLQAAGQPSYAVPGSMLTTSAGGVGAGAGAGAGLAAGAAGGAGMVSGQRYGQGQMMQQPMPQQQYQGKHHIPSSGIAERRAEQSFVPPQLNHPYSMQSGSQMLQTSKQPQAGNLTGGSIAGQQMSGTQAGVYNPASYTNVYHPGPQQVPVSSIQQTKESALQDVRSMFRPDYDRTTFGGSMSQTSGQRASEYGIA